MLQIRQNSFYNPSSAGDNPDSQIKAISPFQLIIGNLLNLRMLNKMLVYSLLIHIELQNETQPKLQKGKDQKNQLMDEKDTGGNKKLEQP